MTGFEGGMEPRRARRRLPVVACLVALAAAGATALVLTGAGGAPHVPPGQRASGTRGAAAGPGPPPAGGSLPLGVFAGPTAVGAAEAVDAALGGRVAYALDFLSKSTWTSIIQATWVASRWRGSPFHLVLGVPMLPLEGATLQAGAAGEYDGYFTQLANRLVAGGQADAVLMVGWQPDDPGNSWSVTTASGAAAYVAYWRRIRTAMASVPGGHFLFEWDPGDSPAPPVSASALYPGNPWVDVVATDAFDTAPATVAPASQWAAVRAEPNGPAWLATFAAAHHRRAAIAMWGEIPTSAGGDGDNAAYVRQLLSWAAGAGLQFCVLWDAGTWAVTGGAFPGADAALVRSLRPRSSTTAADDGWRPRWDASQTGMGRGRRSVRAAPGRGPARTFETAVATGPGGGPPRGRGMGSE